MNIWRSYNEGSWKKKVVEQIKNTKKKGKRRNEVKVGNIIT